MPTQNQSIAAAVLLMSVIGCSPAGRELNRSQPPKIDNAVQNNDTAMTTEKAAQLEAEKMLETYENQGKKESQTNEKCPSGIKVPDAAKNKLIALTFDDGPHPVSTPQILAILKKHQIKAFFFSTGKSAKRYPQIATQIVTEGHGLASHSFSHPLFTAISAQQTRDEIYRTHNVLKNLMGEKFWFRYPFGASTCEGQKNLSALAYQRPVGWHVDTCDWAMSDGAFSDREAKICQGQAGPVGFSAHVKEKLKNGQGGIVLFHDTATITARNLQSLIVYLKGQGYKFVGVDNAQFFPQLSAKRK